MKKKYVTPEMEVFDMELAGVLAASNPKTEEGYQQEGLAPGMMSFDDIDTDYMEENDY